MATYAARKLFLEQYCFSELISSSPGCSRRAIIMVGQEGPVGMEKMKQIAVSAASDVRNAAWLGSARENDAYGSQPWLASVLHDASAHSLAFFTSIACVTGY